MISTPVHSVFSQRRHRPPPNLGSEIGRLSSYQEPDDKAEETKYRTEDFNDENLHESAMRAISGVYLEMPG